MSKNQGLMLAATQCLYGSRIVIPTYLKLGTFRFGSSIAFSGIVSACKFVEQFLCYRSHSIFNGLFFDARQQQ